MFRVKRRRARGEVGETGHVFMSKQLTFLWKSDDDETTMKSGYEKYANHLGIKGSFMSCDLNSCLVIWCWMKRQQWQRMSRTMSVNLGTLSL
jgi:hypothetical protein